MSREVKRANSDVREHRHRHALVDRVLDRPAALARVLDVRAIALGRCPPARTRARPARTATSGRPSPASRGRDLRVVELVLARVEQLEALGVGLHHAVLDAVVDHLHVVAGAGRPKWPQPAVWCGGASTSRIGPAARRPRRPRRPSCSSPPEAPDAAARADVDEVDAAAAASSSWRPCRPPARVAAVDDRVALVEQVGELCRSCSAVGSPDGTISHTVRGASSWRRAPRATRAASPRDPRPRSPPPR